MGTSLIMDIIFNDINQYLQSIDTINPLTIGL